MANKIVLPIAFSEPAQFILYTRYGDPRSTGWQQRWMTNWYVQEHFPWFPKRDLYIHKHFKPLLENAFYELDLLGLQDEIGTVKKCHHQNCDEKGLLSAHCWGAAIDLEPRKQKRNWSDTFIDIMQENDIWCGQAASSVKKHSYRFSMIET